MKTSLGNINLFVRDISQAKRFYVEGIGLEEDTERSRPPSFVLLEAGGCTLTLQDGSTPGAAFEVGSSIEIGFEVEDVEAAGDRLRGLDVEVGDVQQMGWGSALDAVDVDGHRLTLYKKR